MHTSHIEFWHKYNVHLFEYTQSTKEREFTQLSHQVSIK